MDLSTLANVATDDQPYLDFLAATAFSTSDADPAFQKLCEEKPH